MFRHASPTHYQSPTSATAFVFSPSDEEEYLKSHSSESNPLKFLESKPESDLNSVRGKSKIRSHEIKRGEDISRLQNNVLVYVVNDASSCHITNEMRLTGKYQYLPKLVKFGLLTSMVDSLGVLKNAASRPVATNTISISDHVDSDHPLGGLPIGESKYFESVAIAYYKLSANPLRVDGCKITDIKVGGKRIISTSLLSLNPDDGPVNYLHIPLFNNEESLVVKIPRCANMAEVCDRYNYHSEFIEITDKGTCHTDFNGTRLYFSSNLGNVEFHRNLVDSCSDPNCAVSICRPSPSVLENSKPVEDVLPINFKDSFDKSEDLIIQSAPNLPPKPQRTKSSSQISIFDDNVACDFNVDQFRGLDDDAWIQFGLKLDAINKLPATEASLSKMMIRASVLDLVN